MISLTSPVETRAHHWPAGAKLAALCAATLVLFAVEDPAWQFAFCAGMLLLYALPGRAFLRVGLGRLRMLWPFVALILLWHLLTDDFGVGMVIALRMGTAVGLANLVTMTTKLSDMMGVVRWLAAPLRRFGVRTRSLELAVALVVRFTPVLASKGQMLSLAWRARSRRRAGWRIIMPFTVLAIDDAEHVAEALRARGGL
ncbi:energy-coupling factor transporter transmembrane protein EcfT [Sulfitobacter sp. S0837]|uniref:energy-coupling factor transporter transmembrane component T n=1 Tax=Sulfitobacter maritimus TaxID=2741719 RepID=UPI001581A532|nr:energy-coupling factor transporter transmembrane component T [Sulfitobacter maritimus]NUH66628.1 energy-coupling factor transporter transmembrane protein EcfT [Sulfitobacter maritimus]